MHSQTHSERSVTMKRTWSVLLGSLFLSTMVFSCGGSETPTGPNATPTPSPAPGNTATPTAAPTAVPTATPPHEDDNPGPVATVVTKVFIVRKSQGGEARDGNGGQNPYYDPVSNNDVVFLGEFFIIDTTPKNAAGQKCQTQGNPQWVVNHGGRFEPLGNNGIGSNPFQYRANARQKGVVSIFTFIDGVQSNTINVEIR
jgi:hypothetical protein